MRHFPRMFLIFSGTLLFAALAFATSVYSTEPVLSLPIANPVQTPSPDPAAAKIDAVKSAAREADIAMSAVEERRLAASSKTAALEDKCTSTSISDRSAIEFQQLTEQIIAASQPSLPASITEAETKLKGAETKLKTAKDALPTAEPVSAEVTSASKNAQTKLDEIKRQLEALDKEKTKLNAVLPRGLTCAQGLISSMSEKIGPLKTLDETARHVVVGRATNNRRSHACFARARKN